MRRAKSLGDEALAERAVDHLLTCGVEAEYREGESSYDVWVHDEGQMELARRELERFLAAPDAAEFADVGRRAQATRDARNAELDSRRDRTINVRTERHRRLTEMPAFTSLLIAISVAIAVISKLGDDHFPFLDRLAFSGAHEVGHRIYFHGWNEILSGQIWRLVTPMFIHYGPLHLLFNMMWLKDLGGQIEREYGWGMLLGLVLATAVPAHLAEFWWSGPRFGGMSGVVYGLFGYIWSRSRNDPACRVDVDDGTAKFMLIWLVLCMTGAMGSIANAAHLVGLLAGCVVGGGPHLARRLLRRFRR